MELFKEAGTGGEFDLDHFELENENLCVSVIDGKVKIILEKTYGKALVTIKNG